MHSLLRRSSRLFITLAFAALLSACNTGGTTSQSEGNNTAVGGLSNHAPIIQGTPTTSIVAGSAYSFQPVATDPDEDTLVFSITNQPAWASFNTSTGLLSGTPQNANVGLYTDITISASDGIKTVALPAFSIVVGANIPNVPSTDTPSGSSNTSGSNTSGSNTSGTTTRNRTSSTSSTPSGSNTSGSTTANTTPDSSTSSNNPPSNNQVNTGTASLSWTAPSTRFDGTPLSLSQIAGYRVYSGTTSNSLSLVRDLNDGSATSYTVTSLAAATTYYFAVSVYDTNGNESSYSAIASKKIP